MVIPPTLRSLVHNAWTGTSSAYAEGAPRERDRFLTKKTSDVRHGTVRSQHTCLHTAGTRWLTGDVSCTGLSQQGCQLTILVLELAQVWARWLLIGVQQLQLRLFLGVQCWLIGLWHEVLGTLRNLLGRLRTQTLQLQHLLWRRLLVSLRRWGLVDLRRQDAPEAGPGSSSATHLGLTPCWVSWSSVSSRRRDFASVGVGFWLAGASPRIFEWGGDESSAGG